MGARCAPHLQEQGVQVRRLRLEHRAVRLAGQRHPPRLQLLRAADRRECDVCTAQSSAVIERMATWHAEELRHLKITSTMHRLHNSIQLPNAPTPSNAWHLAASGPALLASWVGHADARTHLYLGWMTHGRRPHGALSPAATRSSRTTSGRWPPPPPAGHCRPATAVAPPRAPRAADSGRPP